MGDYHCDCFCDTHGNAHMERRIPGAAPSPVRAPRTRRQRVQSLPVPVPPLPPPAISFGLVKVAVAALVIIWLIASILPSRQQRTVESHPAPSAADIYRGLISQAKAAMAKRQWDDAYAATLSALRSSPPDREAVEVQSNILANMQSDKQYFGEQFRMLRTIAANVSAIHRLEFDPTGPLVTAHCENGLANKWNFENGAQIGSNFGGDGEWELRAPFKQRSPDGKQMATVENSFASTIVKSVDVATGTVLHEHSMFDSDIDISPDLKTFAAVRGLGGSDGIRIVDMSTGKVMRHIEMQSETPVARFSPDGNWLAIGRKKGTVEVWGVEGRFGEIAETPSPISAEQPRTPPSRHEPEDPPPREAPQPAATTADTHVFNADGYCIRCRWERDFIQRTNRACSPGSTPTASGSNSVQADPMAASPTPLPPNPAAATSTEGNVNEALLKFIEAHIRHEGARDLEAILSDYDGTVDYFDGGILPKEKVKERKQEYFSRWIRSSETIVDAPIITELPPTKGERVWRCNVRSILHLENANETAYGENDHRYGVVLKGNDQFLIYAHAVTYNPLKRSPSTGQNATPVPRSPLPLATPSLLISRSKRFATKTVPASTPPPAPIASRASKPYPTRGTMPPLGYSDEQLRKLGYREEDIRTLRKTYLRIPPYGYTREQLEEQGYSREEIARTLGPKP